MGFVLATLPAIFGTAAATAGTAGTAAASFAGADAVLATGTAAAAGTTAAGLGASAVGLGATAATTGITAASATPGWVSLAGEVGTGLSGVGGVIGAVGAYKQGQASASAAKYNAQEATQNAAQASQNASLIASSGAVEAGQNSLKTKALLGSITANQAASGLDLNSGSAPDVRASERALGQIDALQIRANATRQAYGQQVEATNFEGQSRLDTSQASSDLAAGYINAGSTFLSGTGSAAENWAKFQLQGGFSG